jgi:hypothetical protein
MRRLTLVCGGPCQTLGKTGFLRRDRPPRKLSTLGLKYEVVTFTRAGRERVQEYAADGEVVPGNVLPLKGRHWLVERVETSGDETLPRALAKPARYRVRLLHPDGREELGGFRRHRPGAPKLGHAFTTVEDGQPVSWQVIDERLAWDDQGEPYLELLAERDYGEAEALPDHELEHALDAQEETIPQAAAETLARAEQAGLAIELVALEAGEEPDWRQAETYIDALALEEIEDDLLELCGVDPDKDPRDTWLETVKNRLRSDLTQFRADVEGNHDEIEEWDFRGGRILASVGSLDDESNPDKGHGWMCRLADSSALAAAGFERVRKAEL